MSLLSFWQLDSGLARLWATAIRNAHARNERVFCKACKDGHGIHFHDHPLYLQATLDPILIANSLPFDYYHSIWPLFNSQIHVSQTDYHAWLNARPNIHIHYDSIASLVIDYLYDESLPQ